MAESVAPSDGIALDAVVVPIARNEADLRDAYSWIRWHMGSWYIIMLFCIGGLIAAYSFTRFGGYVGALLTLLGIGALYVFYQTKNANHAARVHKAISMYGSSVYTFTPAGFDAVSEHVRTSSTWAVVRKVVETKLSFLVFARGNVSVLVIPKRCVPADKAEQLRALFKLYVRGPVSLR